MFLLFCILIVTNLGENCFISIPDDAFKVVLLSLQKMLSISVPLVFENLVGSVMER